MVRLSSKPTGSHLAKAIKFKGIYKDVEIKSKMNQDSVSFKNSTDNKYQKAG